jgi:hypothetical protein
MKKTKIVTKLSYEKLREQRKTSTLYFKFFDIKRNVIKKN